MKIFSFVKNVACSLLLSASLLCLLSCGRGKDSTVVMPSMGYGIQMKRVPADANGSRPFWISRFPVANNRFYLLIDLDRSKKQADGEKYDKAPAEVSAADAESFCAILNDFFAESLPDGYAFALPTDTEYQHALKYEKKHLLFNTPRPLRSLRDAASISEAKKLPFYVVLISRYTGGIIKL